MHHFNEASLAACFQGLDGTKAVGSDGTDKARYGASLETNLKELVARMKRMAYRPAPVRQVRIIWRVIQPQGAQNVLTASKADTV
jgi:RNA-directed DNA polymerase